MEDDVAAMLAEAFAEEEGSVGLGSGSGLNSNPTPGGLTPSAVSGTPPPTSNYTGPMLNVIRFLGAVAKTSPATPFSTAWAQTGVTGSVPEITAAMQGVYALPTKHLSEVFYNLGDESRRYFHTQCLELSETVAKDMPELSLATALLRWLTQAALPALAPLPESASMNTAELLRKNYNAVDYACLVARPDDSNPEFQKMAGRIASLERELLSEQKRARQQLGTAAVAVVESTPSLASSSTNQYKAAAIALGSALCVAVILIALFATLYYKNCRATNVSSPLQASQSPIPATPSLGGVVSRAHPTAPMKAALDVLSTSSLDGKWGFAGLI